MNKNYPKCLLVIALVMSISPWAMGEERSDEADAINLLKKVQAYVKTNGSQKALAEFNDLSSPFNKQGAINRFGDLYLYGTNSAGEQIVHGKNPKMRGKQLNEVRDIDGVYFIQEFNKKCFHTPEGKGWISYRFPNPLTKIVERKKGYVERIPGEDICIGTGIYLGS
jgi:hypothetical protein